MAKGSNVTLTEREIGALLALVDIAEAGRRGEGDYQGFDYSAMTRAADKLRDMRGSSQPNSPVRQTSCRHCGQDIEGFKPYRKGEWRDRGNNTHCPDDSGKIHAPAVRS